MDFCNDMSIRVSMELCTTLMFNFDGVLGCTFYELDDVFLWLWPRNSVRASDCAHVRTLCLGFKWNVVIFWLSIGVKQIAFVGVALCFFYYKMQQRSIVFLGSFAQGFGGCG